MRTRPTRRATAAGLHLLCALALTPPGAAAEPVRIAELTESWGQTPSMVAMRDELLALGYRENEDFFIGVRFTQGSIEGLAPAARELIDYGVDLIYATGNAAAHAAMQATSSVPIVCLCDAVAIGAAESYARPGRNLTGVSDLDLELAPKRLQLLQELIPGLRRVLFPYHPLDLNGTLVVKGYREGARRLGIELIERTIRTEEEAQAILELRRTDIDAVVAPDLPALNIPGLVLKLGSEQGIPTMFPGGGFWIGRGALISYGPAFEDSGKLAARLVAKILRGGDPSEIPFERNPNVRLQINARTANALGLRIPQSLLLRADEVID